MSDKRGIIVGGKYRHFKTGKIVTVLAISKHTETEEISVVYEHDGETWNRPVEMFLSEVDREKYPDATQKYRFELVESKCGGVVMGKKINLKSCPYCDEEAKVVKGHSSLEFPYIVVCQNENCSASVGKFTKTKKEAIEMWNTRKPIEKIIEELEHQVLQYKSRAGQYEKRKMENEYRRMFSKVCSYENAIDIVKGMDVHE